MVRIWPEQIGYEHPVDLDMEIGESLLELTAGLGGHSPFHDPVGDGAGWPHDPTIDGAWQTMIVGLMLQGYLFPPFRLEPVVEHCPCFQEAR
jgi:hypothetical protein